MKKVHSPAHPIKRHSPVFRLGSEYARTLSEKNLLVWGKNLHRGSGWRERASERASANLNDNNKSAGESIFPFPVVINNGEKNTRTR